jgi:hypothetical protein
MPQAPAAIFKIPTESPQLVRAKASRARKAAAVKPKPVGLAAGRVTSIETRAATRGGGEVIELEPGITVYLPRDKGGRWRAVWHEDGERRRNGQPASLRLRAARTVPIIRRGAAAGSSATRVVARRVLRCSLSLWRAPA